MKYDFDCVVVGAGIAGMTSAIYLKRSNVNVLLLDSEAPGGLLNKITSIENYPGFNKITGSELAYKIYEQVTNLGIEVRYGNVLEIKDNIVTTDIEQIKTKKVILAIGRKARKLENTNDVLNISYCALCDANLYKNKIVAVIGYSNSAIEEAIYLSEICKKVIVIGRGSSFKGEQILIEKLNNLKNVEIYLDCVIKNLKKENNVLKEIETNKGNFKIDGMFVSIGYEPNSSFLTNINKENGYIIVDDKMKTNIDYIYACGDIIKKDIYQLTTAVGEATIAAINVKKDIK
ncbi:MAG TPA: FAD-dependent oxidoreductase [Candidatus Faecisoma merdavium]|nr:FAD-dependent oxidoreductase [Candidatus Faecisoma merdavium]